MSSDNCIAILVTRDKFEQVEENTLRNTFGKCVLAYRVAHAQAIDSFDWYKHNEPHNIGFWMNEVFGESKIFYSEVEARLHASNLHDEIGYTEYGIIMLDAREYNFPGF